MNRALVALALLPALACSPGRSNATAADAAAACRAYYSGSPDQIGRVSNADEVERLAKPLRHSDYNTLGEELIKLVLRQGRMRAAGESGDGNALLEEYEALRRSMATIEEECRALDASPSPSPGDA